MEWPPGEREQFVVLDDLDVGTHGLDVTLLSSDARPIVQETLLITVRDPQVRPDSATAGEGIRVLASPAWPALTDLFDGRAVLTNRDMAEPVVTQWVQTQLADRPDLLAKLSG
ncbi:MAG TPA: hypothetical protein VNT27_17430 [Propionibacteriaceae bacterium]|nr:hypothetical protein [Propionibacteriaceae bacterium]